MFKLLSVLLSIVTVTLAAPIRATAWSDMQSHYCSSDQWHCLFVNDNFQSSALAAAADNLVVHHRHDHVTLFVLPDESRGVIKGQCSNDGSTVEAKYVLSNAEGSELDLVSGGLDGFFQSDPASRLGSSGNIESGVAGDDLVLYCNGR